MGRGSSGAGGGAGGGGTKVQGSGSMGSLINEIVQMKANGTPLTDRMANELGAQIDAQTKTGDVFSANWIGTDAPIMMMKKTSSGTWQSLNADGVPIPGSNPTTSRGMVSLIYSLGPSDNAYWKFN